MDAAMRAIVFDTLAYTKKLLAGGFSKQQAEAQAEAIAELIDNNLVTKRDIEELRKDISADMKQLEHKMIIKLGSLMAASIAIVAALVKLL